MAIKIAIDSNILIRLSMFMDPKFDPDNEVHLLLKTLTILPSAVYRDLPKKDWPPLLKDGWLGQLALQQDGNLYFQNLLDIQRLSLAIKNKSVQLCITPLVYLETYKHNTADFIKKYCTVLTVKDTEAEEFYNERNDLAQEYTKTGAMKESLNDKTMEFQPSNDAYIMAEASLFGLDLITANEKDFIHTVVADKDYNRQRGIYKVNRENNITFNSNHEDITFVPSSKNLENFLAKLRRYKKGIDLQGMVWADKANIDKNNSYQKNL